MTEQEYNELLRALDKEVFAKMIKDYIRSQVPEPYASSHCKQFDDAKKFADFLEYVAKQMGK